MRGTGERTEDSSFSPANRATHAVLSVRRRAVCDSLGSRSEPRRNAGANRLPKQQLPADGSVFLIRLLQLWIVHSNQAARQPAASAAYRTLAGEGEGDGARGDGNSRGDERIATRRT